MRNAEEQKMDGSFALVMRPRWDLRDGYIRKFKRKRIREEAHRSLMMICAEAVAAAGPPSSQKRDGCCQKLETVHQCIPIPIHCCMIIHKNGGPLLSKTQRWPMKGNLKNTHTHTGAANY
jgi:hypothetical protein